MQLEIGKIYKTNHGDKIKIVAHEDCGFIGYDCGLGAIEAWIYKANGEACHIDAGDIIEEWVEPVVHRHSFHVHTNGVIGAEFFKNDKAFIATVQVEFDMSKPVGQRVREIVEG